MGVCLTPPLSATRPLHPLYCNRADLSQWGLLWHRDPQAPTTTSTEVGFKTRQIRTLSSNASMHFYKLNWRAKTNVEPEVKQTALWYGISAKMGCFNCFQIIIPETNLHYTGKLWCNFYQKWHNQHSEKKKLVHLCTLWWQANRFCKTAFCPAHHFLQPNQTTTFLDL